MDVIKPRVHQQELLDFHYSSSMIGTLAWHDMGLGKTLSALWAARKKIQELRRDGVVSPKFLVFIPKSAIPTWKTECAKHTPDILSNMVLVPYSQLKHLANKSKYIDIRFIIFDESHYLKSPVTGRVENLAKALLAIASNNGKFHKGKIFCLSGTPMPNGAMEIYTTWCLCTSPNLFEMSTRLLDEDRYNVWKETFSMKKANSFDRYDPTIGGKVKVEKNKHQGVANEHMLNELLKTFVHFRRSEDCLDLPEKEFNYIDLNLPDDKLLEDANIEEPEAYMALLERLSRAKYPYMVDWVDNFLKSTTEQLVVFSSYTTPVRDLKARFKKDVVIITGEEDDETRAYNLKAFQEKKVRVIAMSYKCGSEALNLQNAFHSLYHGYPWTDAALRQAIARTARSGQKNTTFHHFITSGYNDQRILNIVRTKEKATRTVENLLMSSNNVNSLDGLL